MNPAMSAPSSFREISQELFDDLMVLLCQGRHLALIAPRQSGKALVLYELRARSRLLTEADRPEVVVLRSLDFRGDSRAGFVQQLAGHLGIAGEHNSAGLSQTITHCHHHVWGFRTAPSRFGTVTSRSALWIEVGSRCRGTATCRRQYYA